MKPAVNKYYLFPLVKFFIPFLGGDLLGIYYPTRWLDLVFLFVMFSYVIVYLLYQFTKKFETNKTIFSKIKALNYVLIFFVGYALSSFHNQSLKQIHYSQFVKPKTTTKFQFKVLEEPVEKSKSYKIVAEIIKLYKDSVIIRTTGKVILYLEKTNNISNLEIGELINASATFSKIQSAKNPNEFNYKEYLFYQNIYYQSYIKANYWKKTNHEKPNLLINKIYRFKAKLQLLINKYVYNENERAIVSALLLGNRNFLTDDILKSFSSSGATHILAVSGLHVGIFYGLISFSFLWLRKYKFLKYLHPVITIGSIWFYVLLTGASPSVMRAATMFSFFAIGFSLKRYFSVYNAIAFSAIVLIIINPFIITEVGFQLSYIAVIGIIYLQPKIYKWFVIKNYWGDKIWAITTVSLAAQIATSPLIILYFHQFPNLFWVSNLIVIPAAGIILYGGLLLFVVSWNHVLATFIGHLLSGIVYGLNYCLQLIENVPYALSTGLYISHFQAFLIYILIIWLVVSIVKRSKVLFKYSLLVMLILSVSFTKEYLAVRKQKILTVYHTPKQTAIEIIENTTSYSLIDDVLKNNESQMLFRIKHNWWQKGITEFKEIETFTIGKNNVFEFGNTKVLLIDSIFSIPKNKIKFDFVIISNSPKLFLENFSQQVKAKQYIFDCSNKKWKEKYWKKDCLDFGLDCYFVNDSTAFVTEL